MASSIPLDLGEILNLSGVAILVTNTAGNAVVGTGSEVAIKVRATFAAGGSQPIIITIESDVPAANGYGLSAIETYRHDLYVPGLSVEHTISAANGTDQSLWIHTTNLKFANRWRMVARSAGAVAGDTVKAYAYGSSD